MFTWFKKKNIENPLRVDIHSHLLPGLDDGVQSLEEAEQLILHFQELGYRKLITTPHAMSDTYRNDSTTILSTLARLNEYLKMKNIDVAVSAAAEYYLDEELIRKMEADEPLLTLGDRYLLFETNFITEPFQLKEFIFTASTKGYKPVFAHPERYLYLHNNLSKAEDLLNRGLLFQINIVSLTGYYSRQAQVMAKKLIERGWVHWLGSDCHREQHLHLMEKAFQSKYFQKALHLPLLNNTLE